MLTSTTRVETERAARYLGQLCKHFAHKVPARWDAGQGEVDFPMGGCRLHAEADALAIVCWAEERAALERVQGIVEDHLVRFGWREGLAVAWSAPSEDPS